MKQRKVREEEGRREKEGGRSRTLQWVSQREGGILSCID